MTSPNPRSLRNAQPQAKRRVGRPSRYADVRGAILNAAVDLFSERGYEATSIVEVAALADVPKATLLYYFISKEDLWRAAVDAHWAEVESYYATRTLANLPRTRAGLEQALRAFFECCQRFPGYTRIPALEGGAQNWRSAWIADRHLRPHMSAFRAFMADLSAAGIVKTVDPLALQIMIGGLGHVFFGQVGLWTAVDGRTRTLDEVQQSFIDSVMALLCCESEKAAS